MLIKHVLRHPPLPILSDFREPLRRRDLQFWRREEAAAEADGYKVEKSVFRFSLLYLFLHFTALLADAALRAWGGF